MAKIYNSAVLGWQTDIGQPSVLGWQTDIGQPSRFRMTN